jgi:hypothetical protein
MHNRFLRFWGMLFLSAGSGTLLAYTIRKNGGKGKGVK